MKFKAIDFCKFRIPENGGRVIWEVTNECNYACSYCIFASTGKKPENELSFEKVCETIDNLKMAGFTYIKFTGGEPFLRSDMLEILKYTKSQNMLFDISTNASFITDSLAKELSLLNMEMIHVSMDGHNQETHEYVRGKKTYIKTIEGIQHLKNNGLKIRLGCVIHKENENYLEEMVDFCENMKVDELVFSMMEPVGRMRDKSASLALKMPENLALEINQLKNNKILNIKVNHNLNSHQEPKASSESCPAGKSFLFINSTGDVSPCTWITEKAPQFVLGSLYQNSLEELFKTEKFISFRAEVEGIPGQCPASDKNVSTIKQVKFSRQSKVYSFSTENLDYMKSINFKEKSVLCVGASLDQCIVSFLMGAKSVTNFDVNQNAKYYAQLKWFALKQLSYKEYLQFLMRGDKAFSSHVYQKIKPYLSEDCNLFFQSLYHSYKTGKYIREGHLFNNLHDSYEDKINNSYYLKSEDLFNLAKISISDKDFVWIESDIQDFKTSQRFDVILLSNVADYSHKMFLGNNHQEIFKQKIVDKFTSYLNIAGLIMFAYVFDYENTNNSQKRNILNDKDYRQNLYQVNGMSYYEILVKSAIQTTQLDSACFLKKNIV